MNPNDFPGGLKRNMSTTGLPVITDAPAEKLFSLKKTFLSNGTSFTLLLDSIFCADGDGVVKRSDHSISVLDLIIY